MRLAVVLASSLAPILLGAHCSAQIYVSTKGADRNPGTTARPLLTIQRALKVARSRRSLATGDVVIELADGMYRQSHPLEIEPIDSGTPGHRLLVRAAAGAKPIISGSVRINGWKKVDVSRNLWAAPLPESAPDSRQLYIDGVRATRTRGRLPVTLSMTDTGYNASDTSLATWRDPDRLEFVYTGGNSIWSEVGVGLGSWTEPRCPIAGISGTAITMEQPCWNNSTQRAMLPSGARTANLVGPKSVGKTPSYVENAYELLGTPGQFYIDRKAARLFYTPRPGEDMHVADVELPVIESLLELQGSPKQPVHDVTFEGLQFSYATWLAPNGPDGFSEIQAGYQVTGTDGYSKQALCTLVLGGTCPYGSWTKEQANVRISYSHRISFVRDVFVHLGAAGLDLGEGAQEDLVEGSVFNDISGNGLQLAGVSAPLAPDAEFASYNRIENNLFEDVGAEFRGGIAIVIGYARHTMVSHNQIDHTPYAAISIGWGGWPDKIQMAGQANRSESNIIANNLIRNFMLVLSDGGGIYTQGRTGETLADGERVSGNVIYDQYGSGHGIYTDNGSSMITVRGNVIFHTNHDNWGSRHRDWYDGHGGKDYDPLLIADNFWQQGDADSAKENVTETGNRLINSLASAPASVIEDAGLQKPFRDLPKLSFAKRSAPEPPSRVAAWAGDGIAYVTWNPSVQQGSSPVDSYIIRSYTGAEVKITDEDFWKQSFLRLKGLPNDKPVSFTVSAVNHEGRSPESLASLPVTPFARTIALPAAPENVSVHPANGMASIHFQLPPTNLDTSAKPAPVIAYAITVLPGGQKILFTGRNITVLEGKHATFNVVDRLVSGASYTFRVSAINEAGEGAPAIVGPVKVP